MNTEEIIEFKVTFATSNKQASKVQNMARNFLAGKQLLSKSGIVSAEESLEDKEIIAVYFSAHWCPPCRSFTPVLKDFYEDVQSNGGRLAIIFVSADGSETEMISYFKKDHGEWFAIPFEEEVGETLKNNCSLKGIPKLAIVNKKGEMVHGEARSDVQKLSPMKAYKKWLNFTRESK